MDKQRRIERIVPATATADGDGVKIKRTIGSPSLRALDPFLLLDTLESDQASDYSGGFPDHPHRGFETVTYMLEGKMRHRDSSGGAGLLESGGAQWMTAGRGVIHSEMPEQHEGRLHGFQLWVNLPARRKMIPARYQDIPSSAIPEVEVEQGGLLRLIAGRVAGQQGPVSGIDTDPLLVDVRLQGGAVILPIPIGHCAFVLVYGGSMQIAAQRVDQDALAILAEGDHVRLSGLGGALVVAGQPLGEPIARHGPFVMNTHQEIQQAVQDYETGNFL
ncbi:Pirin domain protein [Magnetococcus marinus MC-1]|uniref:Pirin domain protein n=1 Tax=Magnetococcus marinus (strain ATCC BAA-1437 / JCM 17883 / MC-1) TaxID=156889 RepID=A0L5Q3_MAGMM|nr:pirin family protein [Magnetococcus marinus]ABK43296.1 Pirin domain protein [Magnetococcus marinus MC-1]